MNTPLPPTQPTQYCLYARKSTEGDERQAMSIESQIREMTAIAEANDLYVKDIREERFSAKISGSRQVFVKLLDDVRSGEFDGLLTWAPDRLSRNAGDLGQIVDLMDSGHLKHIRTFSQTFTNNPNEKFLLMILCSQAKLENDQKGINVKRGIRAKCEMGWRPGPTPLGYINRSFAGVKDIARDPDRADYVVEAFENVGIHGHSGWEVKRRFEEVGFTNRSGKVVSISQVYRLLRTPFYFGQFEYPEDSGKWYTGSHEPLITKDLFNKVQKRIRGNKVSKWGGKKFEFKGLFKCGGCGGNIVGEEKYKLLKNGERNRHVYYRCSRYFGINCREKYLNEIKLVEQLKTLISGLNVEKLKLHYMLERALKQYGGMQTLMLAQNGVESASTDNLLKNYSEFVLDQGDTKTKRDLIKGLNVTFQLKAGNLELRT